MPKKSEQLETLRIEADGESFHLELTDRDFGILTGPAYFLRDGLDFHQQLGVRENTSVAQGMKIPAGSFVRRNRALFRVVAEDFLSTIQCDADLLRFDYSFRLTKGEKHKTRRGLTGFKVRGLDGYIDATPNGFCTLQLTAVSPLGRGRIAEIIDMRGREDIETDDKGMLKIYREPATLNWPRTLPSLVQWLGGQTCAEIVIHHRD